MRNNKVKIKQGVPGLFATLYVFEEKDFAKRIEAIEVPGCGCVIQTTVETEQHTITIDSVFVPGCRIDRKTNVEGTEAECRLIRDGRYGV